jgi:hypothetical protein
MKRYFLIPEDNRVFDVICNNKAIELTLDDLRATTNISSLEEVTEEEYNSLAT